MTRRNLIVWGIAYLVWIAVACRLFRHAEFYQPDLNPTVSILLATLWPFILGWYVVTHYWISLIVGYLFIGTLWGLIDRFLDVMLYGGRFWDPAVLLIYAIFFAFCWPYVLWDRLFRS